MQNLPQLTNQLEFLFLKKVAEGLKNEEIDIPTAKKLAKDFLTIEPFSSVDDAKVKISDFSSTNTYFYQLKDYVDAYYSEQNKDQLIEEMRSHIRQGNLDQALEVAKN